MIELYTDGSAKGNPGRGGYGIVLKYKGNVKEFSAGFRLTTNNRMELMALIEGLKALKTNTIPVKVYSDSKYVLDSITKGWARGWALKNFKGKKNADLWIEFLKLEKQFKLSYEWVKGHAGHPENERCDFLAVSASDKEPLLIDLEYERTQED